MKALSSYIIWNKLLNKFNKPSDSVETFGQPYPLLQEVMVSKRNAEANNKIRFLLVFIKIFI
ncbi:MAG: hypothetical protein EA362_07985 [Saprospirales bacterium]|nr:MAG: hypothetical protein EA362_07985 [Saprospirales bacterium]